MSINVESFFDLICHAEAQLSWSPTARYSFPEYEVAKIKILGICKILDVYLIANFLFEIEAMPAHSLHVALFGRAVFFEEFVCFTFSFWGVELGTWVAQKEVLVGPAFAGL